MGCKNSIALARNTNLWKLEEKEKRKINMQAGSNTALWPGWGREFTNPYSGRLQYNHDTKI